MTPYLIVCPLIFLAGFIDSIAGGGGLISLPAYLLAGIPTHQALGTNKLSASFGSATATLRYGRAGFIPWKIALPAVAFSLGGSAIGSHTALLVSDRFLKILMLVLLPLTAFVILRKKTLEKERAPLSTLKTFLISAAIALVLGFYDGFYGPGTGTFLILLLTVAAHQTLADANGISKLLNFASNIASLTVFLVNKQSLIPLGLTAGIFSAAGSYLGTQLFKKKGTMAVKPVILIVLAIFFVKVVTELFGNA